MQAIQLCYGCILNPELSVRVIIITEECCQVRPGNSSQDKKGGRNYYIREMMFKEGMLG